MSLSNGQQNIQANGSKSGGHAPRKRRIGEMLVASGVIDEYQLHQALDKQKRRGGKTVDNLVFLGHMNMDTFMDFMARQPGVPSISLKNCRISQEILDLVPKEFAIGHEIFPIDKMGKLLTVGMVCPLDSNTITKLETLTGLKVKPMLCTLSEISAAISQHYETEPLYEVYQEPAK